MPFPAIGLTSKDFMTLLVIGDGSVASCVAALGWDQDVATAS
jgi:hypothetical protein